MMCNSETNNKQINRLKIVCSQAQVRPTYTQNCDSWKYNPLTMRYEPYMSSKSRYPRYVTTFVSILAIVSIHKAGVVSFTDCKH